VIAWELSREREPEYQGKPLSKWLGEAADDSPGIPLDPEEKPASRDAIRAMGTNALPGLIKMLKAQDSPLKLNPLNLARKHSLWGFSVTRARKLNNRAVFGLCALGTNANVAVPELMDLYLKRGDGTTAIALANLSADGVLALGQALTNPNIILTNKVPQLRFRMIYALGQLGALARKADARPERLARLELEAKLAASALLQCLNDPDVFIRIAAAQALVDLGIDQERAVAVFAKSLTDPNRRAKQQAAFYLLRLGPAAASAVPALVKALQDQDELVRPVVSNALKEISPGAAAKALANTNLPGL
jgi:HEAT repeat protein